MQPDDNNSGVLFKERSKRNPRGPDYTGRAVIDGTAKRIAAWVKNGRAGDFLSLRFTDDTGPPGVAAPRPSRVDDDIPF